MNVLRNTGIFSATLLAVAVMFLPFCVLCAENEKVNEAKDAIAVPYDYVVISPSLDIDKKTLVSEIEGYLVKTGKFRVVPRQDISAVVDEIAMSGGKTVGSFASNLLLTCSLAKDGNQISLTIKILRIISGKQAEIWKTGPHFTADYDKDTFRSNISEMLINSIKVIFEDKKSSFEYALKLCSDGKMTRSGEIFQYVGTDFLPKEATTCRKVTLPEVSQVYLPDEAFRMAWDAYQKGDMKTASEFFLACREILNVQDFSELALIKDDGRSYKLPVLQKKWILPDLDLAFQPIDAGKIVFQYDGGEEPMTVEIVQKDNFWISEKEISVQDYKHFIQSVKNVDDIHDYVDFEKEECPFKKDLTFRRGVDADEPMVCVNWNGATAFAAWLTVREWKAGRLPDGYCYRLPTEKEWDYAARTGSGNAVYYSHDYVVSSNGLSEPLERYSKTGSLKANRKGVFDMYGNVWEWCLDWYDDEYPSDRTPNREAADDCKVVRGGCFYSDESDYGSLRSPKNFDFAFPSVGFRIVLAPNVKERD